MEATTTISENVTEAAAVVDAVVVSDAPVDETNAPESTPEPEAPQGETGTQDDVDDNYVFDADNLDLSKLGFTEAQAATFYSKERDIVERQTRVYGGKTDEHLALAKLQREELLFTKGVMDKARATKKAGPEYKGDDTMRLLNRWAVMSSRTGGYGKEKEGEARGYNVSADIRALLFDEKVTDLVGKGVVKNLPWGCLRDQFLKLTSFNAGELTLSIKGETASKSEGWPEFIKTWIGHYFNFGKAGTEFEGWTNYRDTLAQAIKDKAAEIQAIADGAKTPETLEAEKKAEAANKKNAAKSAANKGLATALTKALAVGMSPKDVAELICSVAKDMEVNLPFAQATIATTDMSTMLPAIAASVTTDEARNLCARMYVAQRWDVLDAIATESTKLMAGKLVAPVVKVA